MSTAYFQGIFWLIVIANGTLWLEYCNFGWNYCQNLGAWFLLKRASLSTKDRFCNV
jgi:hypothetical protein